MIHILRAPNADGVRVEDDVDEALLVKTEGADETDHEIARWVEYRFPDSDVIVHRSCAVAIKKGLAAELRAGLFPGFDYDAWARAYLENLIAKRAEAGGPLEVERQLAPEELAALQRVAADYPGLVTVKDQRNG